MSKTGSSHWAGGNRLPDSSARFAARNVDAELEDRGAARGNPNTRLRDFDLQGGGPVVRDRAWSFVDYWNYRNDRFITGVPDDENELTIDNWTINTTLELRDRHRISARYFTDRRFESNALAGSGRPPEQVPFEDGVFAGDPEALVRQLAVPRILARTAPNPYFSLLGCGPQSIAGAGG